MSEREKTLLKILSLDIPAGAPEIILEEDGDIGLSWNGEIDVSIAPTGLIAYAIFRGGHGTNIDEFIAALMAYHPTRY